MKADHGRWFMNLPAFSGLRLKSAVRARRLRQIQVDWPLLPRREAADREVRDASPHLSCLHSLLEAADAEITASRRDCIYPSNGLAEKTAAFFVRQVFIRNESFTEHRVFMH
jgi:hypothetical protein